MVALRVLTAGSLLVLAVAGCSGPTQGPAGSASTAARAPVATAPSTAIGPNDADEDPQPPPVMPTQDAISDAAAVDLAQRAMNAFARPALDADLWFTELAPLLTPDARSAYYGTNPAEVPPHAVTGPGRAENSPSAFLAYVVVPTDVGDYRLLLSREGGDTGWLVEELTPPAGVR